MPRARGMREMEEPSAKIVGIFQQQALTARGRVRARAGKSGGPRLSMQMKGLTLVVED